MTVDIPKTAMVLSAGYGKRMRPLTDDTPKPMLALNGKPLIGHVMDRLAATGVERAVVNLHYLGDQIRDYLDSEDRLDVIFTEEPELLETGGGVKNALGPLTELGTHPFYVVNSDAFWLDGYEDTLMRLAREWRDDLMDGLLLLQGTVESHGYSGPGDFVADPDGKLARRPEMEVAPWLFAGVQILHPRIFDDSPDGKWSLNVVFDKAIETDRLYGVVHDGEWFHIGTPEGLKEADDFLNLPFAGEKKR
ncbi:MAG: nucleotidyltransferase family protein [Rhodospirillales bacterium]|nr:nucleotidyltransferase family protein [Rhodospirillales bacterium]